jgi:uncharacterized membrane protein
LLISSIILLVLSVSLIDIQAGSFLNSKLAPLLVLISVILFVVALVRLFRKNGSKPSGAKYRTGGHVDSSGFDIGGDI